MTSSNGGIELRSASESETEEIGRRVAEMVSPNGILLLEGDLGAGKTVLVRGVADAVGADRAQVQSPTFTLVHLYRGATMTLTHIDLYRLEPEEVGELGLDELLAAPGIKAIEWPERLPDAIAGAVTLRLRRVGQGVRTVVVQGLDVAQWGDARNALEESS